MCTSDSTDIQTLQTRISKLHKESQASQRTGFPVMVFVQALTQKLHLNDTLSGRTKGLSSRTSRRSDNNNNNNNHKTITSVDATQKRTSDCSLSSDSRMTPSCQPSTTKKESCPSPCSVLDDIYDQQQVMKQQDRSKESMISAVPFSLDESVKASDCDLISITTGASTSSTASICSSSSSSSRCEQVNTTSAESTMPLNKNRYQYRETVRMPVVAQECMKWQAIRKTNLEAKLQSKQQQRKKDNQFQSFCWIACILVSIVYEGKIGRILATLPLAMIIMK